jgi:hypothetical protein
MGKTPTSPNTTVSTSTPRGARGYAVQPGWRLLMQDLGIAPDAVLRRAKLPGDLLLRSDASLSSTEYFRLWRAIEAEAEAGVHAVADSRGGGAAPPVPLRVAQALSADWFDPVLFSALCSADLLGALGRVTKYKRLIGPMRLEVETTARRTTLTLHWIEPGATPPPVLVAFELVFFVQLARMATRTALRPLSVASPFPLEPRAAYEAVLGAPGVQRRGRTAAVPDRESGFVVVLRASTAAALVRAGCPRLRDRQAAQRTAGGAAGR